MIDQKALAYVNLYAVLGALENLCELAPEASEILTNKKPISIGFDVKGGPSATLTFYKGQCRMDQGCSKCDVKLPFSSCEKFNGLIDGTVTPIPSKGFTHIGFLLKDFTKLTDLLNKYMRPTEEDLKDPDFFRINTTLTLYVVGVAIAQLGNQDEICKFSADHIVDGSIMIAVKDGPAVEVIAKNHHLLCIKRRPEKYRCSMEFDSLETANALFNGNVNALTCIMILLIRFISASLRLSTTVSLTESVCILHKEETENE